MAQPEDIKQALLILSIIPGFAFIFWLIYQLSGGEAGNEERKQKEIQEQLEIADRINKIAKYKEIYGEAVYYFYHDALVDSDGIFLPKKVAGVTVEKKYFSLAELDTILKEYNERMTN